MVQTQRLLSPQKKRGRTMGEKNGEGGGEKKGGRGGAWWGSIVMGGRPCFRHSALTNFFFIVKLFWMYIFEACAVFYALFFRRRESGRWVVWRRAVGRVWESTCCCRIVYIVWEQAVGHANPICLLSLELKHISSSFFPRPLLAFSPPDSSVPTAALCSIGLVSFH